MIHRHIDAKLWMSAVDCHSQRCDQRSPTVFANHIVDSHTSSSPFLVRHHCNSETCPRNDHQTFKPQLPQICHCLSHDLFHFMLFYCISFCSISCLTDDRSKHNCLDLPGPMVPSHQVSPTEREEHLWAQTSKNTVVYSGMHLLKQDFRRQSIMLNWCNVA